MTQYPTMQDELLKWEAKPVKQITLRPNQVIGVEAVLTEWETVQSTLGCAFTGFGKTETFMELIKRRLPRRSLVLIQQRQLVLQTAKRLNAQGVSAGIEMADLRASVNPHNRPDVVVSTVQTMVSRLKDFDPVAFETLICDESHGFVAEQSRKVLDHFKQNKNIKIFGCTATPDRLDQKALGQIFETVAFDFQVLDGINDGWLVPVKQYYVPVAGLDWSHIRVTVGELNQGDLDRVMRTEEAVMGLVQPTIEEMYRLPRKELDKYPVEKWGEFIEAIGIEPRRTLVFAVSVAHSEILAGIFSRVMPGRWGWISGATPQDEQDNLLGDFETGKLAGMVNCAKLHQGFDCPPIEIIVDGKPSMSRGRCAQKIGRGLRALTGILEGLETAEERKSAIASSAKPHCTVLDFCGNSKHKLMSVADVLGGESSEEVLERAKKKAKNAAVPVDMTEAMEEAEAELKAEREAAKAKEAARKAKLVARSNYSITEVNPFDIFDMTPRRASSWDEGKSLSEKQLALLAKQGIDASKIPYSQGKQLLNEMFRRWNDKLATMKQVKVLKKAGYTEAGKFTMKEAGDKITALAANGWKKPAEVMP